MTSKQVEIAAEAYAATLLAQAGYDVFVQYGANQPDYDLVGITDDRMLTISVKGSQTGAWGLAQNYKKGNTYPTAIRLWKEKQRSGVFFILVQFREVELGSAPRAYIASTEEIGAQLQTQCNGRGHLALREDYRRFHPRSQYDDKIPDSWKFCNASVENGQREEYI